MYLCNVRGSLVFTFKQSQITISHHLVKFIPFIGGKRVYLHICIYVCVCVCVCVFGELSVKVISDKETLACICADDNPSSPKLCLTTTSVNLFVEYLCASLLALFQRNSEDKKKTFFLKWASFL